MNFVTCLPRRRLQPLPISLNEIFMHYSRTTDRSLKRGYKLLGVSRDLSDREPELSRTIMGLGQEIVEASEAARAEMMLLYLSRDRYGLPECLTAPPNMFTQR